jgi:hypothetical protein
MGTDLSDLMVLDGRFEHNHSEPDERSIQRHKVRQECKRKASDEPGERPNKIIITEIDTTDLLPGDVKSVREETHGALDQYETFFCQDEKMIYINSSETNIVIFSTETNSTSKRSTFLCANDICAQT